MALYVKVDSDKNIIKYPASEADVRADLEAVISLPEKLEEADLRFYGWYKVDAIKPPAASGPDKKIGLGKPEYDEKNDQFTRTFMEVTVKKVIKDPEALWEKARRQRNKLLSLSDWTQLPDADLTKEQKKAAKEYRQKLRDITKEFDSPIDIIWPEDPLKG